jgi:hypothetical protein
MAFFSLFCACSSHTHTFTTGDAAVSVDSKSKDNTAVHVQTKDGSSVEINTGKPITDYPDDVPLYQGKSMMDIKSGDKNARVVALESADSLQKISDFYKSQLADKGWKTDGTLSTDQMTMYSTTKGNRNCCNDFVEWQDADD